MLKKRTLKIALYIATTIFILFVMPVILLNINSVQNFVVQKITQSLSEKLKTEVKVGYIDLRGFNRLKISDLYIGDLSGDTLLNVENNEGRFSILKLFEKKLLVYSVKLQNADIRLSIDTAGILNTEFLNILFAKKETENEKKSLFTFEIDDILLENSSFSLQDLRKISPKTKFNNIFLSEINGRISIDNIAEKYFSGNIKSLSFNEKRGFKLKDFQTTFLLNDSLCKITKTKLLLPNSQLLLDSIVLTYNSLEAVKTNFEKTGINAGMFFAKINTKDLASVSPFFSGFQNEITVRLRAVGTVENLLVERLDINCGKDIGFVGSCQAMGLPDLQHTYVLASIDNLYGSATSIQDLVAGILHKPVALPKEMQNLKRLSYKGKISGYLGNLSLLGTLNSGIGSIKTDLSINSSNNFKNVLIEGNIKTSGLDLGAVTPPESGLGKIVLNADATIRAGKNIGFESKINAKINSFVFNEYNYNNLIINGNITKNTFEGSASIDDKNGKLNFKGNVNLSEEKRKFHFNATVKDFRPNKLNLIKNYPDLALNFALDADFEGDKIETVNGNVLLSDIEIENNGTFLLKKLGIYSQPKGDSLLMTTVESDLINGYISGDYSLATLPNDLMNTLSGYMPILKKNGEQEKNSTIIKKNNFGFYFEIEPLQKICKVMSIAWATTGKTILSGFYNADIKRFNAEIDIPQITNGAIILNKTNFHCYNEDKDIKLYATTVSQQKNDSVSLILKTVFANDSVQTLAIWNNHNEKSVLAGELYVQTKIFKENDSLMLSANILPTQVVLKGNVLDIKKSNIITNFRSIDINNFTVSGNNQNIFLNGRASKSEEDRLFITLENFNLDFVNNFISSQSPIAFGGLVSGNAEISRVFQKPVLDAKLKVPDFTFNNAPMGFTSLYSTFDHERNCLVFNGTTNSTQDTVATKIDGAFFFDNDSLDIKGDANKLNLGFLNPITKNIFDALEGVASGKVHVSGNVKKRRIVVETEAKVEKAHLKVGFLNADLYFNDSVIMKKDSIFLKQINLLDAEGNRGTIDGFVSYKYFRNINYRLNLQCNKMLLFNAKKSAESRFYGKAYLTGNGSIYGNQQQANIFCNITSEPNTKIFIPLDVALSATSNDFIYFVNNEGKIQEQQSKKEQEDYDDDDNANIVVDMALNINPNAEVQLFLDSRAGDMIRATGEGTMRLHFNKKTDDFTLHGKYDLLEGKYLFTFQDVLRKEFKIGEGSSLLWSGEPGNPVVDIKAVYQTEAPLSGIFDNEILSATNRKKALVNCLLYLTGNLARPAITFDLTLPNSDDELNRALKNIVNTDEMMNREIIYLLAFKAFYKPDYMQNNPNSTTQSEVLNVVASTLSQQLNAMASQLFDKWNFGLNLTLDNINNDGTTTKSNEYTMDFIYTPNDRISITGNVGYRDEQQDYSQNSSVWNNYVLDFEIEYKLIQSGKLSAKAYNRTNNYSEFRDTPYTQGIGIVYRENFNSIAELAALRKKNRQEKKEQKKKLKEKK